MRKFQGGGGTMNGGKGGNRFTRLRNSLPDLFPSGFRSGFCALGLFPRLTSRAFSSPWKALEGLRRSLLLSFIQSTFCR